MILIANMTYIVSLEYMPCFKLIYAFSWEIATE
jgi:hypothetical protein